MLEIPWDKLVNIVSLVVLVGQGVLAWIFWSMRKSFVPREHCDGHCKDADERAGKAEARMAQLETAQQSLPKAEDVGGIKDRMGHIEGELKALVATVQGQAEIMKRIELPLNQLMQFHIGRDK